VNVEELFALCHWIDKEVIDKKLVEQYTALFNILNQNAQSGQAKQPFENEKKRLFNTLKSIELERISIDQLKFLSKMGLKDFLGLPALETAEEIIVKNPIDPATAASKIQAIVAKVNLGIKKSNQIKSGLTGLVEVASETTNDVLVRVSFSGDASMGNIVDFKKWGAEWHDIGRGIAMIHGSSPDEIRIVGAKKGSVIIELAVIYGVAMTVSKIILETLKVTERILEIRRKAEEIRGMKLANDKISKELENEADAEKEKEVERITHEVGKRLGRRPNQDGYQYNALSTSVKKLISFLEKGGEVDCVVPEDENIVSGTDPNSLLELRESITQIRALESKIKRIEFRKETSPPQQD
jgi:hypothetical protein